MEILFLNDSLDPGFATGSRVVRDRVQIDGLDQVTGDRTHIGHFQSAGPRESCLKAGAAVDHRGDVSVVVDGIDPERVRYWVLELMF
jgi:hypothetical protein